MPNTDEHIERSLLAERRDYLRVHLDPTHERASLVPAIGDAAPLPVVDFSPGGAAVVSSVRPNWIDHSAELSLRILGETIPCTAQGIRRSQRQGEHAVYGVSLDFTKKSKSAIASTYHQLRFRSLRRRASLNKEVLTALFRDSGYLRLKEGLDPSSTWLRAEWPNTLTHEAVYLTHDDRALGHVAVTRAYPRSWLGHEIATLRDHSEMMACRRTLYQHFSVWPRLLDGDSAHLLGYYNRNRPWHRKMFEDYAARCRASDCIVVPTDRYSTRPLPHGSLDPADNGAEVRTAAPDEDDSAAVYLIEQHWPELARDAFDIGVGRLSSSCMHEEFRRLGLSRTRTLLSLVIRGETVAVALCERSDSQISLFNVLNMAHIFVHPERNVPAAARARLVQCVRQHYARHGAPPVQIACPPGTFKDVALEGCDFVETMGCIVWNATGLRAFEGYVNEMLGESDV